MSCTTNLFTHLSVRAAAVYALGALVSLEGALVGVGHPMEEDGPGEGNRPTPGELVRTNSRVTEEASRQAHERIIACRLLNLVSDSSPLVRYEQVVAFGRVVCAHAVLFQDAVLTWQKQHQ
eukprot:423796-Prorocentrum_minimum.AAC.2